MQKTMNFKKLCSLCLCILLIATIALFTTACTNNSTTPGNASSGNIAAEEMISVGNGETAFTFVVSDAEGKETWYAVATSRTTVGEALMELELIDGEEGPYGIYVKSVNGVTLDYDTDGMYWAFYIGEELAPTGADMTDIVNGEVYRFVAAKG